ncbi:putative reverse transcriptase domain-containing protein, partial [Tanacetum coccineum]
PNEEVQRLENELRSLKFRDTNIAAYTQRFNELALLCPEAVPTEKKKVKLYIKGLPEIIKGETTSSRTTVLNDAVRMAHTLMEQKIQDKAERIAESNKRKWESNNNNQGGEVHIPVKNKVLVVKGNEGVSRLKVISCSKARKYVEKGSQLFLAYVTEKELSERCLEDVPVICEFPEVFPDDLPGLPPPQQVEFRIDLVPRAALVARTHYRSASSEMKELSDQLKELSEKGFIHPSSSP